MLEEPITNNIYWKWASPESQDRMLYIGASYVYDKTKPVEWKSGGKFCYTCYVRHRFYREVLFPSLKSQFSSKGVHIMQSLNKTALEIFSEAHKKNGMTSPFEDMKKMSGCENWLKFIANALNLFKECKELSKKPVMVNCKGEQYQSCARCSKWLNHVNFPMYTTPQQFWEGLAAWLHFVFRAQHTALARARNCKKVPAAAAVQVTGPSVLSPPLTPQHKEEKKDQEKMIRRRERRMSESDVMQSPPPPPLISPSAGGRSDPRTKPFLEEEAGKLEQKLTSLRSKLWMSKDGSDDDDDDVSDGGNDTDDMEQVMANQTQWRGKCGRSTAQSFNNFAPPIRRRRIEPRSNITTITSSSTSSSSRRPPPAAPKPLSSPYGINLQAALIPVGSYNPHGIVYRKIRPNDLPGVVKVMDKMYRTAVALHQSTVPSEPPPKPPQQSFEDAVGSNPAVVFESCPDEMGDEAMDQDEPPQQAVRKSERARKRKRRDVEMVYHLSSTDDDYPPTPPTVSYGRPSDDDDDDDLYKPMSACQDDDGVWNNEQVIDCCLDEDESYAVAGLPCRSMIAHFGAIHHGGGNMFECETTDGLVPPCINSIKHNFTRHFRARNSAPTFALQHVIDRSYVINPSYVINHFISA